MENPTGAVLQSAGLMGWVAASVVIGLVAGCGEPLKHGLDEEEANAMVVTLSREGVDAEKSRDPGDGERWAVDVPSHQRVDAWTVLEREGFPRAEQGGFDDFYPGGGLIPTAQEERVVLQYATARELQSSLMRVDGIIDAHVHLVLPEEPRVQMGIDEDSEPRASVLVQWRQRDGSPPLDADAIRQLVSGGVEDLRAESVHVVMTAVGDVEYEPVDVDFAQVGPVAVAPDSQGLLQGLMAAMGLVIIVLASGLVFVVFRQRRATEEDGAL